jgi:hypothetical protein
MSWNASEVFQILDFDRNDTANSRIASNSYYKIRLQKEN